MFRILDKEDFTHFKLGAMNCGKLRRRATRHNQMGVVIRVTLMRHLSESESAWSIKRFHLSTTTSAIVLIRL